MAELFSPTSSATLPALWADLPDECLELIFSQLRPADGPRGWSVFKASGHCQLAMNLAMVCRAWRRASLRVFFGVPWNPSMVLSHPQQLTHLATMSASDGQLPALVRCFIQRDGDVTKGHGSSPLTKYCLYLEQERKPQKPATAKYLLTALLSARQASCLYLCKDCTGPPMGWLSCSFFGSSFQLDLTSHCSHADHSASNLSHEALALGGNWGKHVPRRQAATVAYTTPIRGLVRPGKMQVTLPQVHAEGATEAHPKQAACSVQAQAIGCQGGNALPDAEHPADMERQQKAGQPMKAPPSKCLHLVSKPPIWHEQRLTWYLDFKGRVKQKSNHNFQLVLDERRDDIILQCGKVENGLFIMDYNPRVITAAQAFATAVTTFDRKSLPFLMRPFKSTAFINSPLQ